MTRTKGAYYPGARALTFAERRLQLPPFWEEIRASILARDDYACRVLLDDFSACGRPASIALPVPGAVGPIDDLPASSLRAVCPWHSRAASPLPAPAGS